MVCPLRDAPSDKVVSVFELGAGKRAGKRASDRAAAGERAGGVRASAGLVVRKRGVATL